MASGPFLVFRGTRDWGFLFSPLCPSHPMERLLTINLDAMILSGKLSPEYEAVTLEMTLLNLFTSEQAYRSGRCRDLPKVTSQRSPVSGRAGEQSLLAAGPLPARLGLLAGATRWAAGGSLTQRLLPRFSVCVLHACCVYYVRVVCAVCVQVVCGMRVCTVPVSCPVRFRSGSGGVGVLAELG